MGCGKSPDASSTAATGVHILAIDTSGSASAVKGQVFKQAASDFYGVPDKCTAYIYRFDNEPAEVYSGFSPSTEEEGFQKINTVLQHTETKPGTNLLKLVKQVNMHFSRGENKIFLNIYTDCGFEEMTNQELDECKSLTSEWGASKDITVKFLGVQPGFREKLRKLINVSSSRLAFLD
jgi:hypothetical protein